MQGKLASTLKELIAGGVDFVLVGGLAAVLQGAPIQTYDVDIVFSQDEQNLKRLQAVLKSLDAIFRIQPSRQLEPNETHLRSDGHLNLLTKFGPLDLLATIGNNLRYKDLLAMSKLILIADNAAINVLGLSALIELKENLGGEKDLATLPILRRTLSESEQ